MLWASAWRREPIVTDRSIEAPRRTVVIEAIEPSIDCGRYPVKREVGAVLEVSADIFKDGHEVLVAYLRYRRDGERAWREAPMRFIDNDRWAGSFPLEATGRYRYTIEALPEPFLSGSPTSRNATPAVRTSRARSAKDWH
jgi:alpha-1,4-glucan:maltose-1-phosphate maltosyltransferase-like protein